MYRPLLKPYQLRGDSARIAIPMHCEHGSRNPNTFAGYAKNDDRKYKGGNNENKRWLNALATRALVEDGAFWES